MVAKLRNSTRRIEERVSENRVAPGEHIVAITLLKFFDGLVFAVEELHHAHAGNVFLKKSVDAGNGRADAAIGVADELAKDHGDDQDAGQDGKRIQRQAAVDLKSKPALYHEQRFVLSWYIAGLLFKIDRRLALDTLAVLPGILIVTMIFRKFVRDANRRIRTAIARINAFLQEYISGMSVVQLFNREHKAVEEFEKRNRDNMLAWRDAILAYALFYPAVEFLSFATIALIYWSGGNRILSGTLTLGVLTAFTMFAQRFFRPIQDLSEKFNILQSAMAASERIFKLLDEPLLVESDPNAFRSTIRARD